MLKFIWSNLKHYKRASLALMAGAALATAVLTGALMLDDSVKFSLARITLERLGMTRYALNTGSIYFRKDLAMNLGKKARCRTAPALLASGLVSNPSNGKRLNRVQVLGIDRRFTMFWERPSSCPGRESAVISRNTAERLGLKKGDDLVLKIAPGGTAPYNAPFVAGPTPWLSRRFTVRDIATDENMGRFSLNSNQAAPFNVFISIETMAGMLDLRGRSNLLLMALPAIGSITDPDSLLRLAWQAGDASLEISPGAGENQFEIRTERIFFDSITESAVRKALPGTSSFFTWMVNSFDFRGRETPYSFVTAADPAFIGTDPGQDGIVINAWLAKDLGAGPGDSILLKYFVAGPRKQLKEESRVFVVKQVIAMDDRIWDPSLMPSFPGISGAANCRDWQTGSPVELKKIRRTDEDYWNRYKGTPKAFISLETGKKIWKNPYGTVTEFRLSLNKRGLHRIGPSILKDLTPRQLGLVFVPALKQGLESAENSTDFGSLFLGLGFFIILAALLLTALMFSIHVLGRKQETGILSALGFRKKQIVLILLAEGFLISLAGSLIGAIAGIFYNQLMLLGLNSIWQDAVGSTGLVMKISLPTMLLGTLAGMLTAFGAMSLVLFRNLRKQIRLQTSGSDISKQENKRQNRLRASDSVFRLALRNAGSRRGRTITVVVLLALGTFTIILTAANRKSFYGSDPGRSSGTGGYGWWLESSIPLRYDPVSEQGRKEYSTGDHPLPEHGSMISMRRLDGDDASCLNLNLPVKPSILGVPAREFSERKSFSFSSLDPGSDQADPWRTLLHPVGKKIIPAFADQTVITWSLRKKTGDTLFYTGDNGDTVGLKIMGGLDNSVFQGHLLVSDSLLRTFFPSVGGFRLFMAGEAGEPNDSLGPMMEEVFGDYGMRSEPAPVRLASFNAVQNTYLSVFLVLGGLGMLIGTAGLGLVLVRNMIERKQELFLYSALGFKGRMIKNIILEEYLMIILAGTLAGTIPAVVLLLPRIISLGSTVNLLSVMLPVIVILLNGILWVWFATRIILGGKRPFPMNHRSE